MSGSPSSLTAAVLTPPVWSSALMWAGFAMWGSALIADWFLTDLWIRRRVYWYTWIAGSALCAAAVVFQGWGAAVFGFIALCVSGAVIAIRWTPFLKVRGRIIAASYRDRRAETPPTTPKVPAPIRDGSGPAIWWTATAGTAVTSVVQLCNGWSPGSLTATALLTMALGLLGLSDGRHRFPLARRQHIQAGLVAALSLPMFAIPALAYYAMYRLGKQRPAASGGKHDAEAIHYQRNRKETDRHNDR